MIKSAKNRVYNLLYGIKNKPILGETPFGGPAESKITFVMIVRQGFDINLPNANSAIRLGYCRGFEQLGIGYRIVSVYEIEKEIEKITNPVVFMSSYDYLDIRRSLRKKLRDYAHIVWVDPNYGLLKKVYERMNHNYTEDLEKNIYRKVSDSHPSFVWAPVPPSALVNYSDWLKYDCRLESIPLACDTTRYYLSPQIEFENMQDMVFVGGYWKKKAIQFDKYLKPYEDRLSVYGYSEWPYGGYKGLLDEDKEKILYRNAKVSPALSEPHAEFTGDIVERAFKIMGSGGLAVPDINKYYTELFSADQLFVPENIKEYNDFVNDAMQNKDLNFKFRNNGYEAIVKNHTYKERAKKILELLNISF